MVGGRIIQQIKGTMRILGTIAATVAPIAATASDFHWPTFHFDSTPVEPLKLNDISYDISTSLGTVGMILVIGALIVSVMAYAKALAEVKAGRMIVYKDWGDFIKSSAWTILIPLGFGLRSDGCSDSLLWLLGWASICYGFYSLWQMVSGAFKYNIGNQRWLALFARVAVTALLLFAVAKLYDEFDNYNRGKYGYKYRYFSFMRGVLLPLAIFTLVFQALIKPMVGTQYVRLRRNVGGW